MRPLGPAGSKGGTGGPALLVVALGVAAAVAMQCAVRRMMPARTSAVSERDCRGRLLSGGEKNWIYCSCMETCIMGLTSWPGITCAPPTLTHLRLDWVAANSHGKMKRNAVPL